MELSEAAKKLVMEAMSKVMAAKRERVDIVEVVRHEGDKMQIPSTMTLEQAAKVIALKIQEEEVITGFSAEIAASPLDGAYAMSKAMEKMFGVSIARTVRTFWGDEPPQSITVEIDAAGHTVQVPWGEFTVPGIDGRLSTSYTFKDGQIIFAISAAIKGKHKKQFEQLVALTREFVLKESIYRGKAFKIDFTGANGRLNPMPSPKFIDVTKATKPIFSKHLEEQLEYDVLAYIHTADAIKKLQGGVLKRGVLLAGPYGTGKTLCATYIAKVAEENKFTFIYTKAQDIPYALDFARTYLPAVVFAEDIDAVATSERTNAVNELLNKLDGVDAKRHDIIAVFTTNHLDSINAAMLRPGRIDVCMVVDPPDAEAAIRVAQYYAGGQLADEDFTEAGRLLNGMIPATIQEAVRRAQIRAMGRTHGESAVVTNFDLAGAARSVLREKGLTNPRDEKTDAIEKFGVSLGRGMGSAIGEAIMEVQGKLALGADAPRLAVHASQNGEAVLELEEAEN